MSSESSTTTPAKNGKKLVRRSSLLLPGAGGELTLQSPTPAASSTPRSEAPKQLGVLYTGYLEKRNPYKGSFSRRYGVLTHEAMHWFIREDGYDLYGKERGRVALSDVLSIRMLDEENLECISFELQTTDNYKRVFRAPNRENCSEWVSAIRSSVKQHASLAKAAANPNAGDAIEEQLDVDVLLVSLKSNYVQKKRDDTDKDCNAIAEKRRNSTHSRSYYYSGTETVLARHPDWNRLINISDVKDGDEVILLLSNGGTVTIDSERLSLNAELEREFDVVVANAPLPSSVRLRAYKDSSTTNGEFDVDGESGNGKSKAAQAVRNNQWRVVALTTDPKYAVNVLISVMIMCVGLASLRYLTFHTSLLFVISFVLASNNIVQAIIRFPTKKEDVVKISYIIVILHHMNISADDPVINNPDEEIPQRFINGCDGDLKEAQRRWDITRHWRETEGVNNIINEPQPYFFIIKKCCPQYLCGQGKNGHYVFYERPGDFDQIQLAARGIGVDALLRHWLFITEYQWEVLDRDPLAKSITVLDIGSANFSSLVGDTHEVVMRTITWANQHYPERSYVIFVVNAPYCFSLIWKGLKHLVHENTQKKVRILSKKETLNVRTIKHRFHC